MDVATSSIHSIPVLWKRFFQFFPRIFVSVRFAALVAISGWWSAASMAQQAQSVADNASDSKAIDSVDQDISDQKVSSQDVIVVCPVEWQSSLSSWLGYRREQGHRIVVLEPETSATALRDRIHATFRSDKSFAPQRTDRAAEQFVILCGDIPEPIERAPDLPSRDADRTQEQLARSAIEFDLGIPTFHYEAKVIQNFGKETILATDLPYADVDYDGIPDLAIGRIPVDDGTELKTYLDRVIAYENRPLASVQETEINIFAGVGNFGFFADKAIEMATRQLLTQQLPPEYSIQMAYASRSSIYCPAPPDFGLEAIDAMNRGGLFWVYIGHGHVQTLDYIPHRDEYYKIFTTDEIPQIACSGLPPIAVMLACYIGAFDSVSDSLAEELIKRPNGPIAVIAGSRVTSPYGMGTFATELLGNVFNPTNVAPTTEVGSNNLSEMTHEPERPTGGVPRMGLAILRAKQQAAGQGSHAGNRKLLDGFASMLYPIKVDLREERLEHLALMNYFGDPLLQIPNRESFEIRHPDVVPPGSDVCVEAEIPFEGDLTLTLQYRRDRPPFGLHPVSQDGSDEQHFLELNATFKKANQVVLSTIQSHVKEGTTKLTLQVPKDAIGRYVLVAKLIGGANIATQSGQILVRRSTPATN